MTITSKPPVTYIKPPATNIPLATRFNFYWKKIGSCDYKATEGSKRFLLRVERMSAQYYWWRVYDYNTENCEVRDSWYAKYDCPATSFKMAKKRVLKAFREYIKTLK